MPERFNHIIILTQKKKKKTTPFLKLMKKKPSNVVQIGVYEALQLKNLVNCSMMGLIFVLT